MRKFWQVVGIAFLAILVAVPAMALDFKFSGSYRVRMYSVDGIGAEAATVAGGPFQKTNSNARNQADLRFRPYFIVEDDNKNIMSAWRLEVGDVTFGDTAGGTVGRSSGGAVASDGVNIETKWAFIDFQIPFGVPARLRAGAQGFYLPKGIILDDDALGVSIYGKTGMLSYNAFWYAVNERANAGTQAIAGAAAVGPANDDIDIYSLKLDFNLTKAFMPYVYGVYRHGSVIESVSAVPTNSSASSDGYWFGIGAAGSVGVMKYDADFVYGYDEPHLVDGVGAVVKRQGWLLDAGVEFPIGPVALGLRGMYGTGDNADTLTKNEDFPSIRNSTGGLSSSYGPKNRQIFWDSAGSPYFQGNYQNSGQNSWAIGGYIEYYPVKALMTRLTYYYIGAPKSNTNFYTGKSTIANEITLLAEYKMYTGVKVWGLAGILMTPNQGRDIGVAGTPSVELKDATVFSIGVQHDF